MGAKNMAELDAQADKVIAGWSFGSLVGNLCPPPFDMILVGSALAKMGWELSKIYGAQIDMRELKRIGVVMAKGIFGVGTASYIGTGLFKYIPGVNLWVALLIQPPIVAAISYAAGQGYKKYFHVVVNGETKLSDEEIKKIAEKAFVGRIR